MRQAAAGQSVTFGGGSGQQQQAGVRLGSAALNRPASLKLSGAWAFYESRHEEDSLRIRAMEKQVAELKSSNRAYAEQLAEVRAQLAAESSRREALAAQCETAEEQLEQLRVRFRASCEDAKSDRAAAERELGHLRVEVGELRESRVATSEELRVRVADLSMLSSDLGMSKESERLLVERLEVAEVSAAEHAARNAELEADNASLLQQRDHHLHHAELLMKEKNRYFTQLQELRRKQAEAEAAQGDSRPSTSIRSGWTPAPSPPSKGKKPSQKQTRTVQPVAVAVSKATASFTKRDAIREAQRHRTAPSPLA